jgi:phosphoenolpyruvate synthase/pyruvate phosphate dikinase
VAPQDAEDWSDSDDTSSDVRRVVLTAGAGLTAVLDRLVAVPATDTTMLAALAGEARAAMLAAPVPDPIAHAVVDGYRRLGPDVPVAVRSSATAEDLPHASFAGQQDTYLHVVGPDAVMDAVRRCWASLWTDRAVVYRAANGIDQRAVRLAVVIQRMIEAEVAGVLFTANPVSGRRRQAVIDASPGRRVTFRTLDIGGDKVAHGLGLPREANPFLGVRAIRLCLNRRDLFRTHLRAILRAGHGGKFQIMFPMISDPQELRDALSELENVRAALTLVARKEAVLGIVYETDAKVEPGVKIVGTFPPDSHPAIIYPVAATTTGKPEASDYLAFLRSTAAKTIFEKYGFKFLVSPST